MGKLKPVVLKDSKKKTKKGKGKGKKGKALMNVSKNVPKPNKVFSMWGQFRGLSPFAPHMFCSHRFVDQGELQTAAVLNQFGSEAIYALNDPYACGPGIGIHSNNAYEYSTLASVYQKSKVYAVGVKITFEFPSVSTVSATQTNMVICGAAVQPSGNIISLTGGLINTRGKAPEVMIKPISEYGSQKCVFKKFWKIRTIEGLSKIEFNGDMVDYDAAANASPAKSVYLRMAIANCFSTAQFACQYSIEIDYYTKWFDRLEQ